MVRFLLFFAFAMCGGYFSNLQAQDSLSIPKFNVDLGVSFGLRHSFLTTSQAPTDKARSVIQGVETKGSLGFSTGLSLLASNNGKNSFRFAASMVYSPTTLEVNRIGKEIKTTYVHSLIAEFPFYFERKLGKSLVDDNTSKVSVFAGLIPQVAITDLDIPPFPAQIFNLQFALGGGYNIAKANENNISKTLINIELRAGLINLQNTSADVSSQWFNKFFRNEVVLTVHFL